jgi:hypothetical protein
MRRPWAQFHLLRHDPEMGERRSINASPPSVARPFGKHQTRHKKKYLEARAVNAAAGVLAASH